MRKNLKWISLQFRFASSRWLERRVTRTKRDDRKGGETGFRLLLLASRGAIQTVERKCDQKKLR